MSTYTPTPSISRVILLLQVLLLIAVTLVNAHGNHQVPVFKDGPPGDTGAIDDWATRHMQEEHHINNFDPNSFFALHDFDSTGIWTSATIRRFYGLEHETSASVAESRKLEVVESVLAIFDPERTGSITRDQFLRQTAAGKRLPDFGLGPGHHGDDEYEYEIHHFEKYHSGDDVKLEDLNHPEDIEHFKKHDEMEDEEVRIEGLEKMMIVEDNIPSKFRKQGGGGSA